MRKPIMVEIIFAEFGNVQIDVEHFRGFFPDAKFKLITSPGSVVDSKTFNAFDETLVVNEPYIPGSKRYGWRMNDYWQIKGMLDSTADICIAFDADMRIVSREVATIIPLAAIFGLCLPANSRMLARVDATIGDDGGEIDSETHGNGYALNAGVTALCRENEYAWHAADTYCEIMRTNPSRAPLAWWRALTKCEFSPCLLPQNWCVCAADVGIGNEIILHVGHQAVVDHYKNLLP